MRLLTDEYIKNKYDEIQKLHPEKYLIIKLVLLGFMIFDYETFKEGLEYYSSQESLNDLKDEKL